MFTRKTFLYFIIFTLLSIGSALLAQPVINTQPQNQTVTAGQTANFTIGATGTGILTYQWKKNGTNISGAVSTSYTTPATVPGDNGATFSCVVTDDVGSTTSNNAILTVGVVPTITTQPASQAVAEGQSVTFTITASGSIPITYQWKKNGANISGATSASYAISSVVYADNGANFSCVAQNAYGSVTSNNATLTVGLIPAFTLQPTNQTVEEGQSVTFTIAASGTAPIIYQWKKNGANITGANSASYTI